MNNMNDNRDRNTDNKSNANNRDNGNAIATMIRIIDDPRPRGCRGLRPSRSPGTRGGLRVMVNSNMNVEYS